LAGEGGALFMAKKSTVKKTTKKTVRVAKKTVAKLKVTAKKEQGLVASLKRLLRKFA
jgi:hypothetical protein